MPDWISHLGGCTATCYCYSLSEATAAGPRRHLYTDEVNDTQTCTAETARCGLAMNPEVSFTGSKELQTQWDFLYNTIATMNT